MNNRVIREKRFAVTGCPVLHSKSPPMFNALFREQSEPAIYNRIAASTAEEAIFLFNELELTGMNVTAPFKKEILYLLDRADIPACRIGGVNTVIRTERGLIGYNTDHSGVVASFKKNDITLRRRRCVVLGAGSAGRAAAYGLTREKAEVIVVNRTFRNAEIAARDLGCKAENMENLENLLDSTDILVSTVSAAVDFIPGTRLPKHLVVFDANYHNPLLAEKAKKKGLHCY